MSEHMKKNERNEINLEGGRGAVWLRKEEQRKRLGRQGEGEVESTLDL